MKTILKKAVLKNCGVWTTTITWYSLIDGSTYIEEIQKYENRKHKKSNYTHTYNYTIEQFDEAYNKFHELLKTWI